MLRGKSWRSYRDRFACGCLGLLLLTAAWEIWGVRGNWIRQSIVGDSMAPVLLGEHRTVVCRSCQFPICVSGTELPPRGWLPCPNCGNTAATSTEINDLPVTSGDRVWIHRWILWWRRPIRWEVVALNEPDILLREKSRSPSRDVIKRVVGLPGENIQIRSGDIYINGVPVRRPPGLERQMSWLLHVDRYHRGWWPESDGHVWERTSGGYAFHSIATATEDPDWLVWYPTTRSQSNSVHKNSNILDDVPYNLAESRPLHRVDDLVLDGVWRTPSRSSDSGELGTLQIWQGPEWLWEIDPRHEALRVYRRGLLAGHVVLPEQMSRIGGNGPGNIPFRVARVDGYVACTLAGVERLRVGIDGPPSSLAVSTPNSTSTSPTATSNPHPDTRFSGRAGEQPFEQAVGPADPSILFAFRAKAASCQVVDLVVSRDSVILAQGPIPVRTGSPTTETSWQLGQDEFFLLGDNSPVSLDSRVWGPISGKEFKGIVRSEGDISSPRGIVYDGGDSKAPKTVRSGANRRE